MTERDKVIKGLEVHLMPNSRCKGCPYPNNGLCGDQLFRDAIAPLKAQERELRYHTPQKLEHKATLKRCCTCPSCGNVLDQFEQFGVGKVRIMNDYCHFCGQALDWSDEEKSMVRF